MDETDAQRCTRGGRRRCVRGEARRKIRGEVRGWAAAWVWLVVMGMAGMLPGGAAPGGKAAAAVRPMTPGPPAVDTGEGTLPKVLADAADQLKAPDTTPEQRAAAARKLLASRYPAAMAALGRAIADPTQPGARGAALRAVALSPRSPPAVLAKPIRDLLGKVDPKRRSIWGAAVGRFDDPRLTRRLTDTARNAVADLPRRLDAIAALGYDRTQRTARDLVALMNNDPTQAIQSAACSALGALTGLDQPGTDREAWRRWWRDAGRYSSIQWEQHLRANFAQRLTRGDIRQRRLVDRLIDAQQSLYRATAAKDRPAVLTYMLGDPLEPIRNLGMDLAVRRLLDGVGFAKPLLQGVRDRLTDPSAHLRQRAVLLLRDLMDEPAAKIVAQRLARGKETDTAVRRADLKMMARLPQPAMVDAAYKMLSDPTLRDDAAGALAAAADQGALTRRQTALALRRARELTRGQGAPAPQLVTLLAKVGEGADWRRIAGWIASPVPGVKRAAAQAWAQSGHSLRKLARRAGDPVIQPIVIAAAIQRGNDPSTLQALAAHRPDQDQARQAWARALAATARRVPVTAVLPAALKLKKLGADPAVREAVLTAALRRVKKNAPKGSGATPGTSTPSGTPGTSFTSAKTPASPAPGAGKPNNDAGPSDSPAARRRAIAGLILERGEVRLARGDAASASGDFARLDPKAGPDDALTADQRARLYRGEVRCYLLLSDVDKAFAAARRLLGRGQGAKPPKAAATDDPIVGQFLQAARRMSSLNHDAQARRVLKQLRLLLGPRIKPEVAQRIAVLEARIQGRTLPESVPGAESAGTTSPAPAPSPASGHAPDGA